jgi:lipoyl-dependent peroxiredoxin
MSELNKVQHTADIHTTGGPDGGSSRTSDGRQNVSLALPGSVRTGTNQSSCLPRHGCVLRSRPLEAIACRMKIVLPAETTVYVEIVDLHVDVSAGGLGIKDSSRARRLPGFELAPHLAG